jgi:hypothetical protein
MDTGAVKVKQKYKTVIKRCLTKSDFQKSVRRKEQPCIFKIKKNNLKNPGLENIALLNFPNRNGVNQDTGIGLHPIIGSAHKILVTLTLQTNQPSNTNKR